MTLPAHDTADLPMPTRFEPCDKPETQSLATFSAIPNVVDRMPMKACRKSHRAGEGGKATKFDQTNLFSSIFSVLVNTWRRLLERVARLEQMSKEITPGRDAERRRDIDQRIISELIAHAPPKAVVVEEGGSV